MGCPWPRRGIRAARRPVRTRNTTVFCCTAQAPLFVARHVIQPILQGGVPCPQRRAHWQQREPMTLFISTRSRLGIRAESAKAPMVAGWVPSWA